MEFIDYSKNWDMIFSLPVAELSRLNLRLFDEEDLDALTIRLKELGETERVLSVYEAMLNTDRKNPAVEYMNIYEKIIIHCMSEQKYYKAILLLKDYLHFDENKRNGYRNHFIRRNLGISLIFGGDVESGEQVIKELINESPNDCWTYYDIGLEYYFAGDLKQAMNYLQLGAKESHKNNNDFWYHSFCERIAEIEKL